MTLYKVGFVSDGFNPSKVCLKIYDTHQELSHIYKVAFVMDHCHLESEFPSNFF
jgi:hypothetical protein